MVICVFFCCHLNFFFSTIFLEVCLSFGLWDSCTLHSSLWEIYSVYIIYSVILYSLRHLLINVIVVVQSLSHVHLSVTPWTAACHTPLSSTISWSWLKFMFIESVMLSNPSYPLPSSSPFAFSLSQKQSFPVSWLFTSGGQSVGASALASVLPVNIEGWIPLELTGLISSQSKGLSSVFSNTTVQKHQAFKSFYKFVLKETLFLLFTFFNFFQ